MNFEAQHCQYTNSVNENCAIMFLYDIIGYDPKTMTGIKGVWFAEEMNWHKTQGRDVTVYINSPGGKVFDAFSIIQAIIDGEANTHIVGMAASAAGWISQFGKVRTANDFATLMIHGLSNTSDDKLYDILKTNLTECLTKRSKLKEAEVDELMTNGKDNWMDSSEMLEKGLVDSVIVTGVKIDAKEVVNMEDNYKLYSDVVNSLTHSHTEDKIMKALIAELNLPENSTEADIAAKIKELKGAPAAAEDKLKAEQATNKSVADQLSDLKKSRATELVDNALAAGKITKESVPGWVELATNNYDTVKNSLGSLQAARGSVNEIISASRDTKVDNAAADDYENLANNYPDKLAEMAEKEPEKFDKLAKAYYAKKRA